MSPRLGEWSLIRIISSHLATSSHTSDTHSRYTHQPWSRSYQHLGKLANICSGCCSKLQLQMSRILCSTFTFCLPTSTTCLYVLYATVLLLTLIISWIFSQPEHSKEILLVKVPVLSSTVVVVTWVMSYLSWPS